MSRNVHKSVSGIFATTAASFEGKHKLLGAICKDPGHLGPIHQRLQADSDVEVLQLRRVKAPKRLGELVVRVASGSVASRWETSIAIRYGVLGAMFPKTVRQRHSARAFA